MDRLTFGAYQEQALTTKIYPSDCTIFYPALGLAGEAGELCNKIKKIYRDHLNIGRDEIRNPIKDELGDCLWYIAALADDLGFTLEEIAIANIHKLTVRAQENRLQGSGDDR